MKRYKKFNFSKNTVEVLAAATSLLLMFSTLTSCNNDKSSKIDDNFSVSSTYKTTNNDINNIKTEEPKTLEQIAKSNPFYFGKWAGQNYLHITEDALLDVITIALDDVSENYLSMGATNMKLDKNNKPLPGKENFRPDWLNKYFFLARAKRETGDMMVNIRVLDPSTGKYHDGIMALQEEIVKETLQQYFLNIFHKTVDLSDVKILPDEIDVQNVETSAEARLNILQTVYNNVCLSIAFDIYSTKCLGPNHPDYYEKYGGFSEELRSLIVACEYLFGYNTIIPALKNGTFFDEYVYNSKHYGLDILEYQKYYTEKYENAKVSQMGE